MPVSVDQSLSVSRLPFNVGKYSPALLIAGVLLWAVSHPYQGLYQDANLYAVTALGWLNGDTFARDPFFLFGSQGDFSLFTPFYGALISVVGVSDAARSLVLVSAALWLGAAWLAARRIFDDEFPFGVAFLYCAVLSLSYSPVGSTFVLNEHFATARAVAIPLAITGIAIGASSRFSLAVAAAATATAFHPLLGVWALLVLVFGRCTDRAVVVLVLVIGLLAIILVASGLVPALQPVSFERWLVLRDSTTDLLVAGAEWSRLNALLFWVAALLLGSRFGSEHFRRSYSMIALVSALGYLLSVVVSIYYPVDFFLRMQAWRAVWLAAYFSVLALLDVAWVVCRSSRFGWRTVVFIAALLIICKPFAGVILFSAWAVTCRDGVLVVMQRWGMLLSPVVANVLLSVSAGIALPAWLSDVRMEGESLSLFGWTAEATLRGVIGGGGYGVGPVLLCMLITTQRLRRWVAIALVPALLWVANAWDSRAAPTRDWENSMGQSPPPIPELQRGQTVYWPNGLPEVWFGLGTSGYVGIYHLSGLVFSEERTNLVSARWRRAAAASVARAPIVDETEMEEALAVFRRLHPERRFDTASVGNYATQTVTADGLKFLCADKDLDWIVADVPRIADVPGVEFSLPGQPGAIRRAYACNKLRNRP